MGNALRSLYLSRSTLGVCSLMGVADAPSAQLCLRTRSVLALAGPSHTVSVAAMHSVQASLSRVLPLCRRSCSQCFGRRTPERTEPMGVWKRNWAPGLLVGTA
eukprot:9379608-Pyramimonas_sp.AAC.1